MSRPRTSNGPVDEVPAYKIPHQQPRRHRHAICVFVINEGDKIRRQLQQMAPLADRIDLIVADGGSTDHSFEGDILKETGVTTLLVKTGPGKLSAQMRMAFSYALGQGYEGILTIDGNGKDGLQAVPAFIEKLEEGYDHIQGSRFIPGGHHAHTPLARLLGLKLLHAPLISLSAGFRYTDTTNGFRAYSRKFLLDPRLQPFRDLFSAYELHYYLAIQAARLGYRICEVPVSRCYPSTGPAPTKIKGLSGNLLVLKTLFKAALRCYDPEKTS